MANSIERLRRANRDSQALVEGIEDIGGGATTLVGEILLRGTGEKLVEVVFPAPFTEKPIMSFGGEIQDRDLMVSGQFPTVSVVVSRWNTKDNPPYSRLFIGCELAIVVTGPSTQKMIVSWAMNGTTISNIGIY